MKRILLIALLLSGLMPAVAQVKKEDLATKNTKSPGAETSFTINGKNLWIYYHAPSVRGRHIFNGTGALQPDGSVWRLGADYATVLHTDADLDLNGLAIPKGDYTLYADLDNGQRSEEYTSELQSRLHLVCRLLLEKKKKTKMTR